MGLNQAFTVVIDIRVGPQTQRAKKAVRDLGNEAKKTEQKTKQMSKGFANARTAVGALAGAFTGFMFAGTIRRGIEGLLKPTMEFETALHRIAALTGAKGNQLTQFAAKAQAVAAKTPFGPTELLDALKELRRATGSTSDALASLGTTASMSMASFKGIGLQESVKMQGEIIRGFGIGADQIADANERLLAISRTSGLGIENYSRVMGRLSIATTMAGQSFDEIVKAFSLVNRMIKSPERATTRLLAAMRELGRTKARDALEQYGIAVTDSAGQMRRLSDIVLDISQLYMRSTKTARRAVDEAFGARGAEPIMAIVRQLTGAFRDQTGAVLKMGDVYDYMGKSVKESGGIFAEYERQYRNSPEGQLELTKEALYNLAIEMGRAFLPVFQALATTVKSFAEALRALFDSPISGHVLRMTLRFVALTGAFLAGKAVLYGVKAILSVVISNILPAYAAAVDKGIAKTTAFKIAVKGATLATKSLAAAATFGLAFFPEILKYSNKLFDYMTDRIIKLKKTGKGTWFDKSVLGNIMFWYPKINAQMDAALKKQEAHNKAMELAVQQANKLYQGYHMASQEMDALSNKLKGISSYKPPMPKATHFNAVEKQMRMVMKRASPEDQAQIATQLKAMEKSREIIAKSKRGVATNVELQQLTEAAYQIQAGTQDIGLRYGLSPSLAKNLGKTYTGEVAKMGSLQNLQYSQALMRLRGYKYLTNNQQISGTTPYGGYRAAPPKTMSWLGDVHRPGVGNLPMYDPATGTPTQSVMGGGQIGESGPQSVFTGTEAPGSGTRVMTPEETRSWMVKQDMSFGKMLQALNGTLRVYVTNEKDPLSGAIAPGVDEG